MNSRSQNTKRNIRVGLLFKIVSIIFPFVIRTIIIETLGDAVMGLTGVLTSILSTLSVAELGFSTAIVCTMYKPVAEEKKDEVCALLNYYRKIYRNVGLIILICGIAVMPILPVFLKEEVPNNINAYIIYGMYLINSSLSYFLFSYKSALLNVMQRMDLVQKVQMFVQCIKYVFQIIVLILCKNYYLFMIVYIISTVLENLIVSYLCDKRYPDYKCIGIISKDTKIEIKKQVSGMMVGRICDTTRNTFDTLIISFYLGLTMVTIYGNYYQIYLAVYTAIAILGNAMQASVANKMVMVDKEENYQDLRRFQFIHSWIVGFCSICMLCLYQPFMRLWMGERLLLPMRDVILFSVYMYLICACNMRNMYVTGNSLFWKMKTSYVMEAIANLVLNILLGKLWGTTGVLIATIITIVIFNFIQRNYILFRNYFEISPLRFHLENLLLVIIFCLIGYITFSVSNYIIGNNIISLVIRLVICLLVPNIMMFILFFKSNIMKESIAYVRGRK